MEDKKIKFEVNLSKKQKVFLQGLALFLVSVWGGFFFGHLLQTTWAFAPIVISSLLLAAIGFGRIFWGVMTSEYEL
jgi:hypothetical protein